MFGEKDYTYENKMDLYTYFMFTVYITFQMKMFVHYIDRSSNNTMAPIGYILVSFK